MPSHDTGIDIRTPGSLEVPRFFAEATAKREMFRSLLRHLSDDEVATLEKRGNHCGNWKIVMVHPAFSPEFISNNRFTGACSLGLFTGKSVDTGFGFSLPSGIFDSILMNASVADECCVWNVGTLNNYHVGEGTILYNTETLSCSPTSAFGNGRSLTIGIETGGREVISFADITVDFAWAVAQKRIDRNEYLQFIDSYIALLKTGYGVIGSGCRIANCPEIIDTLVGNGAVFENTLLVNNITVMSTVDEPATLRDGVFVRNSCIQCGCSIDSMALVDESILVEHSHVERHGKVTHSILGPNTGIAEGEVTASLVGPFVGFHHQSLLIGALWPSGKGNVAYGANVGSNHTGKAPDQEIYCGEGMFFGLGVNIKFPADFSESPYSIIATGVTTLPQRMRFPFSLINTPARLPETVSPAYNELLPGWVLSDNLYLVKRNETKFLSRNKARRSFFQADVFRPDIINCVVDARNRCLGITQEKAFYTDADLPGTGKNFITRANLLKAIDTYTLVIEYYCLRGVYCYLSTIHQRGAPLPASEKLYATPSPEYLWEHCRTLCISEGIAGSTLTDSLDRLVIITTMQAEAVAASKEKDDVRGKVISDDYTTTHTPAREDAFVKNIFDEKRSCLDNINHLRQWCSTSSSS